ncbi:MAG: FxsA family protein [Actinomycetota bacterium]|nr:FxsA family protein [Actinomycetota bacterium]
MRWRWILFGAFVVVPIMEIALLIAFSRAVGIWWTIGLVVVTAFVGSWLVTRQGRDTIRAVRLEFERGAFPAASLAHGAMILLAGAFLLTPGLLTDAVGFLLLVPAVRETIRRWFVARSASRWTIVP